MTMSGYDTENYWKRIATSRISRRRALGGGAAASSLMALALAGCGSSNNNTGSKANTSAPGAATSTGGATTAAGTPAAPATVTTIGSPAATSSTQNVKTGGTLSAGIQRDATNLDSARSQDVYSGYVQAQIVEPLFYQTNDFKIGGNLVAKVENPDNTTYLFHLQSGVKFQDDTNFDADAVKWNLQRHIDDAKSIRNADMKPIVSMESIDASTLKIVVSTPYAPFLSKLTSGAGAMYSPTTYQKVGADKIANDLTGAGSGPFKFASWQHDNQITLEKNSAYWRKDAKGIAYPYLDKLIFKPIPDENTRLANLKTGDLDYIEAPPPKDVKSIQSNSDLIYRQIPGIGMDMIILQTQKEPFNDKRVRQALAYSLDRQQLAETVFFGTRVPSDTEIPGSVPGSITGPYMKQDIAKAKDLLKQAGREKVSFTVQYSNASAVLQQTFELVKDQIGPAGFDMTLQPLEFATIVSNTTGANNQAAGLGWSGSVDPDGFCYILFKTGAGQNLSHFSSPEVDALLDKGQQTLDLAQRVPIYQQVMQKLADEEPFVIYDWTALQQTTRKNVQNFQLGPSIFTLMYMVWKS